MDHDDNIVLRGLQYEVDKLLYHWIIFVQVYGSDRKNIEVLRETAGLFFGLVQSLFLDYLFLTIGKLTEPAKSKIQENVSIENAIERLSGKIHPKKLEKLKKDFEKLKVKSRQIKRIRHKYLAHFDKDFMAEMLSGVQLKRGGRKDFDEILSLIKKIMNEIEVGFGQDKRHYDALEHNAGNKLMESLKKIVQNA